MHIIKLMTTRLSARGEGDDSAGAGGEGTNGKEAEDGQEYQRNLDKQGEAEIYMQVYSALLADMREALINERNLLAAHEVKERKLRKTLAARRAALESNPHDDEFSLYDDEGEDEDGEKQAIMNAANNIQLSAEHFKLRHQLTTERKELLRALNGRAVKSVRT